MRAPPSRTRLSPRRLTMRRRPTTIPRVRRFLPAAILLSLVAATQLAVPDSARDRPVAEAAPPAPPCADAHEHALPLPTTVPPAQFVVVREAVLAFLQSGEYRRARLVPRQGLERSPCATPVHSSGCLLRHAPGRADLLLAASDGVAHRGPEGSRSRRRHDHQGAVPPAGGPLQRSERRPAAQGRRLDGHDQGFAGAKDGWFWGEFFDGMTFDDDQPPFQYPWAGFAIVLPALPGDGGNGAYVRIPRQHPGISGAADRSSRRRLLAVAPAPATPLHAIRVPRTPLQPAAAIRSGIPPDVHVDPGRGSPDVQTMPSETYDHVVAPAAGGRYISSSQCMSCHGALNGPFGPTMFLPSPAAPPGTDRRRQRLAVRRMALVADGAGRARPDILRAGGKRARLSRHAAAAAERATDEGTDELSA